MNDELVRVLQALADCNRLEIIKKIYQGPLGGSGCAQLSSGCTLSQPAMSHHYKILLNAGIITGEKRGTSKIFKINEPKLKGLGIELTKLLNN